MKCPECQSKHINKNGKKKGKQNYICVDCKRQFIECHESQKGYPDSVKRECLTMYVNGWVFEQLNELKEYITQQ